MIKKIFNDFITTKDNETYDSAKVSLFLGITVVTIITVPGIFGVVTGSIGVIELLGAFTTAYCGVSGASALFMKAKENHDT